jgi:hypothetical protein
MTNTAGSSPFSYSPNSMAATHYPQIIKAGTERNWAWLAHGQTNSVLHAGLSLEEERQVLADITSGRVMALALHPFVTGQAFRAKYFDQALAFLAAQPDIWLTTSDEIAEHFRRTVGAARPDDAPSLLRTGTGVFRAYSRC